MNEENEEESAPVEVWKKHEEAKIPEKNGDGRKIEGVRR